MKTKLALLLACAALGFTRAAEKMNITLTFAPNDTNDLVIAYNVYATRTGTTNWARIATTLKPPVTVTVSNASTLAVTAVNRYAESDRSLPIVVPWIVYGAKWTQIVITR